MRPAKINIDWITHPIYHFDIDPWGWTEVANPKDMKKDKFYTPEQFKKWKGEGNLAPFRGYTKLAGVLALSDTNDNSGGFECVPGFQNCIKKWCEQTLYETPIQND